MTTRFEILPPLSDEEYDALRDDIATNGVLVPVTVDQNGYVIDGHNRLKIADELGLEVPRNVREFASDDERLEFALKLNMHRRHLSQWQKRELIASEVERTPEASDRAIAKRLGVSPTTVGTVRRGPRASNLDASVTREVAEALTEEIGQRLNRMSRSIGVMVVSLIGDGYVPADVAEALDSYRVKLMIKAEVPEEVMEVEDLPWRHWLNWLADLEDEERHQQVLHAIAEVHRVWNSNEPRTWQDNANEYGALTVIFAPEDIVREETKS